MTTDDERAFNREAGARLAVLRRHLGHTPATFAEMLDISVRTLCARERGERVYWGRFLESVLDATGVSASWLFNGDTGPETPRNDLSPRFLRGSRTRPPALRVVA